MSRLAVCALVMLAGCARQVTLEIHHPRTCCAAGEASCDGDVCPLEEVRAFRTRLIRLGGTREVEGCEEIGDRELCPWSDLENVVFLDTVMRPSDASEVQIEGLSSCEEDADVLLTCDSFGDTAADLEVDDLVRIWCACPL